MKIWLDDVRIPPDESWAWAKDADIAMLWLDVFDAGPDDPAVGVSVISFDHDLGDERHSPEWTGYTVISFLEKKVAMEPKYVAPEIRIHTANSSARGKMELAKEKIEQLMRKKISA